MLEITPELSLPLREIVLDAVRAQGAGGQNIHKTSSAVHLRFDIEASSLPEDCRQRLLNHADQRRSTAGVIVIKAQRFRSLEQNRDDALQRLAAMIRAALVVPKIRRATKPTRASKRRRVDDKTRRGSVKALRRPPAD
ncbi:MAG TPA: alternative ribosome rescue aminoacyl-tRNA hydrolase ArfB [Solimonas sp.]